MLGSLLSALEGHRINISKIGGVQHQASAARFRRRPWVSRGVPRKKRGAMAGRAPARQTLSQRYLLDPRISRTYTVTRTVSVLASKPSRLNGQTLRGHHGEEFRLPRMCEDYSTAPMHW
jgi:hypothetical protein